MSNLPIFLLFLVLSSTVVLQVDAFWPFYFPWCGCCGVRNRPSQGRQTPERQLNGEEAAERPTVRIPPILEQARVPNIPSYIGRQRSRFQAINQVPYYVQKYRDEEEAERSKLKDSGSNRAPAIRRRPKPTTTLFGPGGVGGF